jgi:hypothetical protein
LGCGRRQDQSILAEFLVEAVMLSLVAGMVGMMLGVVASTMISYFAN